LKGKKIEKKTGLKRKKIKKENRTEKKAGLKRKQH